MYGPDKVTTKNYTFEIGFRFFWTPLKTEFAPDAFVIYESSFIDIEDFSSVQVSSKLV